MRVSRAYIAALFVIFAALAMVRYDLTIGALDTALTGLSSGWLSGTRIVFGALLFGSILFMTARVIAVDTDPSLDCLVILSACVYGYLAELAGTVSGLWSYYTGERPPLWIIPAWPIGALVIMRLSRHAGRIYERVFGNRGMERLYWVWMLLFYAVFIPFTAPRLTLPGSLLAAGAAMAVFLPARRPDKDFSLLLTGMLCVFWADLWGTFNRCWVYHIRADAAGILFGMLFDSLVVLASIKTGRALRGSADH